MNPAKHIQVDRLALHLPATGSEAARHLALLVAEGLDEAAAGMTGTAPPHAARIAVQARAGEAPGDLAARIVEQILGAVERGR